MKTKIILFSILAVLVLAIGGGVFWWVTRPQIITFGDDARVILLAVDYGKHHVPPAVKIPATTNRPARQSRPASFNTTNDTLIIWVRQQYDQGQWHNFEYFLYDDKDVACVKSATYHNGNNRRGNEIVGLEFSAFPRRGGKLHLKVVENSNGEMEASEKPFLLRNPGHGPIAEWQPEPLPATKNDSDLSVTLTALALKDAAFNRAGSDESDVMNRGVEAIFHIERNGKTVTDWEPVSMITSDATGNSSATISSARNSWQSSLAQNNWKDDNDVFEYQYGLWPDEPAWKLNVEFSQKANFADDELWTIPTTALQRGTRQDFWNFRQTRTSPVAAETTINGVHLKLYPPKIFTDVNGDSNPQGGFYVQADRVLPEGMHLSLATLTDDHTNNIEHWEYTWNNNAQTTFRCEMRDIYGMTNLNITVALHRSRFVEFIVAPPKPGLDSR
jgi:hypothetical protein